MEPISKNELLMWLDKLVKSTGNQLYLHFKGKVVLKSGESTCSEDGHTNYLYREFKIVPGNIFLDNVLWSRPMGMFLENIPFKDTPRFKQITPQDAVELLYPEILQTLNPIEQ